MKQQFASITGLVIAYSCAIAAQGEPSYDPGEDLGKVVGFSASFGLAGDLCGEKFPEYRNDISVALDHWKKRNDSTLQEINARWRSYLDALANGNKETRNRIEELVRKQLDAEFQEQRSNYLKLPKPVFREVCRTLPEKLESNDSYLEVAMQSSLDAVRKQQPSPSR